MGGSDAATTLTRAKTEKDFGGSLNRNKLCPELPASLFSPSRRPGTPGKWTFEESQHPLTSPDPNPDANRHPIPPRYLRKPPLFLRTSKTPRGKDSAAYPGDRQSKKGRSRHKPTNKTCCQRGTSLVPLPRSRQSGCRVLAWPPSFRFLLAGSTILDLFSFGL